MADCASKSFPKYRLRLATTEELEEREELLKKERPEAIPILLLIQTKLRYPVICDQQIFIPQNYEQHLKSLIIVKNPQNSVKPSKQSINAWFDINVVSDEDLRGYFHNVEDWDWHTPFILQCSPGYLGEKLSSIFSESEFSGDYLHGLTEGGQLMTLSPEDIPDLSLPTGYKMDKLHPCHMPYVFDKWEYSYLEDLDFFTKYIDVYPSTAIFKDEDDILSSNPVSYNLQYKFGIMGALYTATEYRNLGFASYVEVELVKYLVSIGDLAAVWIVGGNDISVKFHEKNGFKKRTERGGWYFFINKNETIHDVLEVVHNI